MAEPSAIVATDQHNRDEIAEALGWACQAAKRQQHIVERFTDDTPTQWTRMHRKINDLLDQLDQFSA